MFLLDSLLLYIFKESTKDFLHMHIKMKGLTRCCGKSVTVPLEQFCLSSSSPVAGVQYIFNQYILMLQFDGERVFSPHFFYPYCFPSLRLSSLHMLCPARRWGWGGGGGVYMLNVFPSSGNTSSRKLQRWS